MKGSTILLLLLTYSHILFGQVNFSPVYQQQPEIPKGILEAVAFTQTRIQVIDESAMASCSGMPLPYGVMGLFENGSDYFIENGKFVAELSEISVQEQKVLPQNQVLAYAKAFNHLFNAEKSLNTQETEGKQIYNVLCQLSEIPDSGIVNLYARDAQIYEILLFMMNEQYANEFNFTAYSFDLRQIFGNENLKLLSASKVYFTEEGIINQNNDKYTIPVEKSTQYGPAIWNPAPTCNYSSRNGTAISAITIHTVQGSYAGAISWAQNCSSSVSYHYVVRSSDGQITQMVDEANKAWHVGSENPYTIGYEHEGYIDNPAWYTEALYNASANLSRDIVNSGYGILALRTYYGASSSGSQVLGACTKIKGHQHFSNQSHTDPGINWNWEKYYRLINNNPTINTFSAATGSFYDSGGVSGNYSDDERLLWLIEPSNVSSITMNFNSFNIESGYDKLFIYDGATINSPLIGTYTGTNSPGIINSSSGSLLIEFRSDCGTVNTGWAATYTSTSSDDQAPVTTVVSSPQWQTQDFSVNFIDSDNIGVVGRYYLVADRDPATTKWSSNGNYGFCNELFSLDATLWNGVTGAYTLSNGSYIFEDTVQQNSNTYYNLAQDNNSAYLYEWNQTITSNQSYQRAGIHFFCDDPTLPNRGNSYFVYFRETEQKAQIFKVENDVFTMKTNDPCVVTANTTYTYKVTYDPQSGWIKVYSDGILVTKWQDIEPLQSGNSISLRTGGCKVAYDNIRVFRARGSSANVTVGTNAEMRYQSEGGVASAAVRSMVIDEAGNWSNGMSDIFLIDWTAPEITFLHDGLSADIDTTFSATIHANWSGSDIHSFIGHYEVAVGILPSLNNVSNWTNLNLSEVFSHTLISPIYDQVYHISLRVVNGAELTSLYVSDGQRLVDATSLSLTQNELEMIQVYPNPVSETLTIVGLQDNMKVCIYDMQGKLVKDSTLNVFNQIDVQNWAAGTYQLVIQQGNSFILKKIIVE